MGNGRPPAEKGVRHDAAGQAVWNSDEVIVVKKRANKVRGLAAESVERRASAERNLGIHAMVGTQSPAELDAGLTWVREAAAGNRALRFDNLLHHVTVSRLELAYRSLRKDAASGVDEEDWTAYGIGLEERLVQLHEAV